VAVGAVVGTMALAMAGAVSPAHETVPLRLGVDGVLTVKVMSHDGILSLKIFTRYILFANGQDIS
jgi:hypothetical protein